MYAVIVILAIAGQQTIMQLNLLAHLIGNFNFSLIFIFLHTTAISLRINYAYITY